MRDLSIGIIRSVGVDTGGCNIQFAVNPRDGRLVVIEMNPRVSRSQRAGLEGDRLPDRQDRGQGRDRLHARRDPQRHHRPRGRQSTPAAFEPTLDYVVVKVPRFAFEKFPGRRPELTTHMKSVGEAMAIGRNFTEALQKALRSLESKDAPFDWHQEWVDLDKDGAARGDQGPARRPAQEGHGRAARRRDARGGLRGHPHRPVVRRPAAADQRGRGRGDRRAGADPGAAAQGQAARLLRRPDRQDPRDDRRRRPRRPARARASGRSSRPSTPAPRSSRRRRRTTTRPTTRRPRSRRASGRR